MMAEVRVIVTSEYLGTVEVTQESKVTVYNGSYELQEIEDLLKKATENIHGAFGIVDE